uniref:Uncharacterized protein n=1 Tax=viral metagenome TaxID=1070528 RepID=A0A6M3LQH1_9ZZZZ
MKVKVELTYFKESGKYYSEGSYETPEISLYQIFEQVKLLIDTKKLPGLMEGHSDFYVLVDVPSHPNRRPRLFVPGLIFKQLSADLAQKESPKEIIERLKFKLESIWAHRCA